MARENKIPQKCEVSIEISVIKLSKNREKQSTGSVKTSKIKSIIETILSEHRWRESYVWNILLFILKIKVFRQKKSNSQ